MKIANDPKSFENLTDRSNPPVLVPTMGNLHAGHVSLVEIAREQADGRPVVASIFVNPLQFGPDEDFDTYPRTFEADCDKLARAGCDIVFAPTVSTFYPSPQKFRVMPDPALASVLEGESRQGFFEGVCTVVMKLLCATRPSAAVFGSKDFQQLMIVRAMVRQFAMPIDILAGETVRESDGLAKSSRNGYLEPEQRREAPHLYRALQEVATTWRESPSRGLAKLDSQRDQLQSRGWEIDYFGAYDSTNLSVISEQDTEKSDVVLLAAAILDQVRLIDNLEI